MSKEIQKYFEINVNKNTINQNSWDAVVAVLRGKFIALNTYIRTKSKINNLGLYLRKSVKEGQIPKEVRIRAEINEI